MRNAIIAAIVAAVVAAGSGFAENVLLTLAESEAFPLDHQVVDTIVLEHGSIAGDLFSELWPDDKACETEEFKLAFARNNLLTASMLSAIADLADYCRLEGRDYLHRELKGLDKLEEPWPGPTEGAES
jgi:hypothetical protein